VIELQMQLTNGTQTNSPDNDSTPSDSMSFYSCTSRLSKINTSEANDEKVIYYYFIIKHISNFLSFYYYYL
jgi:hypothetical protein